MTYVTPVPVLNTSSYRVKFDRNEFLRLVEIAQPQIIYNVKNLHFFAYDGFIVYSLKCKDTDFGQRILKAEEFSNSIWTKK
ncbi:MAG: hypothetical protein JSV04_03110 [Candidatus Heimdallarchaeota archaeon]|nr:MAG: hypothetical protein JSV04_03110 [Candidatus Heimdallarchaeota archaeon]